MSTTMISATVLAPSSVSDGAAATIRTAWRSRSRWILRGAAEGLALPLLVVFRLRLPLHRLGLPLSLGSYLLQVLAVLASPWMAAALWIGHSVISISQRLSALRRFLQNSEEGENYEGTPWLSYLPGLRNHLVVARWVEPGLVLMIGLIVAATPGGLPLASFLLAGSLALFVRARTNLPTTATNTELAMSGANP